MLGAIRIEDGQLLPLKINIEMMFLAELDICQNIIDVTTEPGQFRNEKDVDIVRETIVQAFRKDGAVFGLLRSTDVFLEGSLNDQRVVEGILLQISNLSCGILSVSDTGHSCINDCFHIHIIL